jgi:serine/threonine protein kinase
MGRYSNLRVISRGGMATIYSADDPQTGGRVALKEVCVTDLSPTARAQIHQRLEREAVALSRLDHPNIVRYYGIVNEQGSTFIVTELLDGTTLEQEIVSGRIVGRRERIADIFAQVSAGMAYASKKGIVHRDIKPGNIFLCRDGRVKIIDFGIARMDDVPGITLDEQVLGTPHYMSPEQTAGGHVDIRSDIFSTGVCLYHASTGELPFNGKNRLEVGNAIRFYPYPEGRVWPEFEPILHKALAKNPTDRWKSFDELYRALVEANEGEPCPPESPEPLREMPTEQPETLKTPADPQRAPGASPLLIGTSPAPVQERPRTSGQPRWLWPSLIAGAGLVTILVSTSSPLGYVLLGAAAIAALMVTPVQGSAQQAPDVDTPLLAAPPRASTPIKPTRALRAYIGGVAVLAKPSPGGSFVVGRGSDCNIRIDNDARVSSRHATIEVGGPDRFTIRDHSSNGTFLNGERVSETVFGPNDEIRVGGSLLRVVGLV